MSHYSKSWEGKPRSSGEPLGPFITPRKYVDLSEVPMCRGEHTWKAEDIQGGRLQEKCVRCPQIRFTPYHNDD